MVVCVRWQIVIVSLEILVNNQGFAIIRGNLIFLFDLFTLKNILIYESWLFSTSGKMNVFIVLI